MAADFYLHLEGIKGESTDSKHPAWIECTSVNWSITQPKSATASTSGGHTAERADLSEITISKLVDLSSPMLAQLCACGKRSQEPGSRCNAPMAKASQSSISRSSSKTC